jgi:hypothetical protein
MRLGAYSTASRVTPRYLPLGNGLGDAALDSQIVSTATGAASAALGIMTALHTVIAGTAIAGPVGAAVGAAIAAIAVVSSLLIKVFSGCGQTCIIASNDANKYEPILLQNLNAYLQSPIHYTSMQTAALANFDAVWGALTQACSDPSLGTAGQKCISDRQSGACIWQASFTGWVQQSDGTWHYTGFGPAGSGSTCFNWFAGYRDPIANDPSVVPDPVPGAANNVTTPQTTGATVTTGASTIPLPLILGGAALLLLVATEQ